MKKKIAGYAIISSSKPDKTTLMELKAFRNKYDLELIPASNEKIILGSLVWDPLLGNPSFKHKGMSNHIFNTFYDAGLIDKEIWSELLSDVRQEPLINANFAERTLDIDQDYSTTLQHPQLDNLQHVFEIKKVRKFSFSKIQAKVMSNLMRLTIDEHLDLLKKNKWEEYDGKIRRLFLITELYYGNISIIIENRFSNELELALQKSALEIEQKTALGHDLEYTFEHQNVPFAMSLERVRHFNG